ncbi:MAG TPA: DUF1853 family protein [Leeuwenhoekiella sp.]|nr:DUF1853 family protein [Leeuwenhoekiella sp.]
MAFSPQNQDNSIENRLQKQYNGFLNSEVLFKTHFDTLDFFELKKILLKSSELSDDFYMPQNIRLGQRMEFFMEAALKATNHQIQAKNLQIIHQKKTLGEIDFIIKDPVQNSNFQLEMVYKFYLFDPAIQGTWSQQWIGGNRRDSLYLKLKKLQEKQLPLLYAPETAIYLDELHLKTDVLSQKVCFMGQLFLPYEGDYTFNEHLNPTALKGFWITKKQLNALKPHIEKILIPPKNDWVVSPALHDEQWKTYKEQAPILSALLDKKQNALAWMLDKSNVLKCFFLVWW